MAKVVKHQWHLFDASGQVVGRFSTHISNTLRGKYKPTFTNNVDCGDTVVIVNADKVVFTGKKWDQKVYYKHSGYIGGLKETKAAHVREKYPERVLLHSIRGMLPKTMHKLQQLKRLHIYSGPEHPFPHMFPNQPKLIKKDEKIVKMHEHFRVLPEYQDQIQNQLVHIPAQPNGITNPARWLKKAHPEEYEEWMAEQEVRLTPAQFKDYQLTKQKLARKVSIQKRINHGADLEEKFKYGTKLKDVTIESWEKELASVGKAAV